MSHTQKSPPIAKPTSDLPTDVGDGTWAFDTTENKLKVRASNSWNDVGGGGGDVYPILVEGPSVVSDGGGIVDEIQGDIPANWKDTITTLTGLLIGTSCTSIGIAAFQNCVGLAIPLIIPNSVTTIGSSAFNYCESFTGSLTIPDSVTTIGDNAFISCTSFNGSLTIGNSVTTIGSSAFFNCSSITSVSILATTAPTIGSNAFFFMTSVSPAEIHVPAGATGYAASYNGLTVVYDL